MKKLITLLAAPILAFSMSFANADSDEKRSNPVKELIQTHMLETGFITQADLDARAAEKEELKAMIEELKELGDKEGVKALLEEAKLANKERREVAKAYVEDNPDLAEAISVLIEELRERRQAERSERRSTRG